MLQAVLVNLDIFSLEEVNSNSGGLKVGWVGFIWKSPQDSSPLAILPFSLRTDRRYSYS